MNIYLTYTPDMGLFDGEDLHRIKGFTISSLTLHEREMMIREIKRTRGKLMMDHIMMRTKNQGLQIYTDP